MGSINLKTKLPGPKSLALMAERNQHIAQAPFHVTPLFVESAKGCVVTDVDGNQLLDFAAGIGVVNVGHSPEQVVAAVTKQAGKFLHTSFNVAPYELYTLVCAKLNELTPGSFPKKSFLANSGAEAVENAIKIARTYTKRQAVICFDHAFHGRTFMAMTLTAKANPYKLGFAPFMPEVYRAPFPYLYRSGDEYDCQKLSEACFTKFKEMVLQQILPQNVAAVIIEPVLGEGGIVPAPREFLQMLQKFCNEHGIVFIADEIQTGFGRTGSLFASEQMNIEPDLVTCAKGIAAGLPLAAVVGRAEIMDSCAVGTLGGTYGGNPLACAAALEVFNIFATTDLLKRAQIVGEKINTALKNLQETNAHIGDVRGLGAMQAIEIVKDRKTKQPYPELTKAVIRHCYDHGLILMTAGTFGNVIRLLPPLVVTEEQVDEGLEVIKKVFRGSSVSCPA